MDEEGWTTVKGKRRRPKNINSAPSIHSPPSRSTPYLEVNEIKDNYDTISRNYLKSVHCEILRAIVQEFTSDNNQYLITKAICLGIGTFDPPDGSYIIKQRAHAQLAAFLVIVEELERLTGGNIKCIFQEPVFSPSDISFLTEMGHRVVDSPEGSDAVDSKTFFFGVHLYKDVYSMSLQGELPAVFVGTGWHVWSEELPELLPDGQLSALAKMAESYKAFTFPVEKGDYTFYKTGIFLRPRMQRLTNAN